MTNPSNPWGGDWGRPSRRLHVRDQVLSRRQARRMSQRFAGVGVGIPAARLQAISAGAPAASDELVSVDFALAAIEIKREERLAKLKRRQRRGIRWLIVAGLVLVALNLLLCMAYLFVGLTLHDWPF
jgi:hypothetical protein